VLRGAEILVNAFLVFRIKAAGHVHLAWDAVILALVWKKPILLVYKAVLHT